MKALNRRAKSVVGLDVGSYSVKLVHLLHQDEGYKLLSGLEEECFVPEGDNQEKVVEAIEKVFRRAGLRLRRGEEVVTSVSGSGTTIKQVNFPLLTDEELRSSIKWQASKHLPFGPEEAVLDYQVLSRDEESESMSILLAAVTKTHLAEHLELLRKVGIEPLIIDLSPLALLNTLLTTQELVEDRALVVLDMGAKNTILSVYRPGGLFFTREISVSGHKMTSEVQKQLGITYEEAEEIKREGASNQKLLGILKAPLDRLVFEIRRSLTYYENRTGKGGFDKLYLAGGSSRLVKIDTHIQSNLGVPVEELNPLKGIEIDESQMELRAAVPQLTLAVGLALRDLED